MLHLRSWKNLIPSLALGVALLAGALSIVPAAAAPTGPSDEWIASLEGGWAGESNTTPLGTMPFALLFDRQENGSLRAFSAYDRGTYIEVHFLRSESGEWLLKESASLGGLGHQSHTLSPVGTEGDAHRWVLPERPGYLVMDMSREGSRLVLDVTVRGEPHARFELDRLPDSEVPALREALEAQAERDPSRTPSLREALADDRTTGAIREAREVVRSEPRSVDAHLKLAEALYEGIQADPMSGGTTYAGEMLTALEKARALDPSRPEPYHWLAGYYLNAPPIAGGSVDKAVEMAQLLREIDPDAGTALLAEIQGQAGP
jgi:hypothetical protein